MVCFQSGRYLALEDYCAVGSSEVSMKKGDIVELLKVGCAGWWYVKVTGKFYLRLFLFASLICIFLLMNRFSRPDNS